MTKKPPKTVKNPDLSIIVPLYNEAKTIDSFFATLNNVLLETKQNFEIICINDNSTDSTLEKLSLLQKENKHIKIINFSRNFGKEAAITAGLDFATGNAIIPIDADMQDPPDLIPQMIKKWQEGYMVVLATRRTRNKDNLIKRITASAFYKIIKAISHIHIPQDTGDFRLMDRQVVETIKLLPERTRFMKGLFAWVGFPTTQIYFDRPPRITGSTTLNFWKLWQLALDGIFSFSTLPLKVWTYLGSIISILALIYATFLIAKTLILGIDVPGYTSIMTSILFMGGIQLISIGIIGEYIARIYKETKQRPIYIIKDCIGIDDKKTT